MPMTEIVNDAIVAPGCGQFCGVGIRGIARSILAFVPIQLYCIEYRCSRGRDALPQC